MSHSNLEVLLFIETSRAYGRGVIKGVAKYALEQGDWSFHFEDRSLHDPLPVWLKNWKGDGIITRTTIPSQQRIIRSLRIPYVELFGTGSPDVCCDDFQVGRLAAEHFISRGLFNFAFFSPEMPWWCRHRFELFSRNLRLFGHECHCFNRRQKSPRTESPSWNASDDRLLKNWLCKLPKPVGLFAATDAYALTVLGACRRYGIHVPDEIAILGADNDKTICLSVTPQLSSIDVNSILTGYTAAALLQSRIRTPSSCPEVPILTPPAYVVTRQSTDVIAIADEDVVAALSLLRKNATKGMTVVEVAGTVGLSLSTLNRRFSRYVGHSPEREIIKCKINEAKKYLRETNLAISIISKKAGFEPPEYFIRAFKKEVGLTPIQYRKTFLSTAALEDDE